LVAQVAQRDAAAFEQLYNRHVRTVYVLVAHTLGDAEAEEVVQDVFLRLWHKAGQFDVLRGSFAAWLMTIARNRVLDALRKHGLQQRLAVANEIDAILAETLDSGVDVERESATRADRRMLIQALRALPAEQRRAIVLAYFSGLTHTAIADSLGWPVGTVKKRIRLGMQKLRAVLSRMGSHAGGDSGSQYPPE
jgi:RNA polymerase sigma-70 factor (ECF subfamily)